MKVEKLHKYPIYVPKSKNQIKTPENEIDLHCVCTCVGIRGSGKTNAVSSKLIHLKEQGFCSRVFLLSPTAHNNIHYFDKVLLSEDDIFEEMTNKSVEKIMDIVNEEADEYYETLELIKLYEKFAKYIKKRKPLNEIEPQFLQICFDKGIVDMFEMDKPPELKYGKRPIFHLVVDDAQSSQVMSGSVNNKLTNLTIRHRHLGKGLGISIWYLVQSCSTISGIPRAIRENSTILILFHQKDLKRIEQIAEEVGGNVSTEDFIKSYEYATNKPYGFLVIECKNPVKLRSGWDEIISFD